MISLVCDLESWGVKFGDRDVRYCLLRYVTPLKIRIRYRPMDEFLGEQHRLRDDAPPGRIGNIYGQCKDAVVCQGGKLVHQSIADDLKAVGCRALKMDQ